MEIDPATQVHLINDPSFPLPPSYPLSYTIFYNLLASILQGDAGIYECHANNKWSVDMRSFRTDYNIFFD